MYKDYRNETAGRKKLNILNRFSMNKKDYEFEKVTFTESCQCEIIKGGLFEQLLK